MFKITKVTGREILDSRGTPTVEATVTLECGKKGIAAVPSGASTGSKEALELRDGDKKRYNGKGVTQAIENIICRIAPALEGEDASQQRKVDAVMIELDGTKEKKKLGANATLAVSLATARAAANALNVELFRYIGGVNARLMPIPMMNILNGGMHSDAPIDFQEFMIRPKGAPTFAEGLRYGAETFHALKSILADRSFATAVGDEGGFAPALPSIESAFECIIEAIELAGFKPGEDISLAIDCAASEFYDEKKHRYEYRKSHKTKSLTSAEQAAYLATLAKTFPIDSIEDGMSEFDVEGWQHLNALIGDKIQIVSDDLTVTNPSILKKMAKLKAANAILIKPNQIGTLSETLECIELAREFSWNTVISHRSGETCDTFIADLAVAVNAGQIKTGSLSRSERIAKYNRLLAIESEL